MKSVKLYFQENIEPTLKGQKCKYCGMIITPRNMGGMLLHTKELVCKSTICDIKAYYDECK